MCVVEYLCVVVNHSMHMYICFFNFSNSSLFPMLIHACSVPCVPEDIHENVRMCMMFVYIFFCFYSVFYVINAVYTSQYQDCFFIRQMGIVFD